MAPYGAVDIRSGRDGSLLRRLLGPPPAMWAWGHTVAMTGDLDGDGIPDVIVGDNGPYTPGAIAVLGSVSGALIHRWQVNTMIDDNFGFPSIASVDVDRDGFEDVIASAHSGNAGQYIYSGRDGSLIQHFHDPPNDVVIGTVVALRPQAGDPFPRYVCQGGSSSTTRTYMFSGAPDGVERTGLGSAGTLPRMPVLCLRKLIPSGFRVTLAGAEPGAFAWLVIGFDQGPLPYYDLSQLGFTNCALHPQPALVGFFVAGTTWPEAGYVAHDFAQTLVPASTPGSFTAYLQWIVFGQGSTWPGGVSEAMRMHVL
ncbi:MAG TPA: VCBS repeat-containing protein [Planctomycetota bacterium]|nr:VCBS repeat-containing protein [Planctomycetota bacterium]